MKVCFVTTGSPSTNPRLVKEADACTAAGWQVHVVASHWADWATPFDERLLASRPWAYTFVDWRRESSPLLFWKTRVRHWAARRAAPHLRTDAVMEAALSRVGPELEQAAIAVKADLFVAHNLGALPAARAAATAHGARLGFDAEDFHSGQLPANSRDAARTQSLERRLLPSCAYVTAASPGIADAYRELCGIRQPTCVLNVFPLADRPVHFRPTEPDAPLRIYWFSQTIGADRGLEAAVQAIGLLRRPDVQLHLRGTWQPGFEARLRSIAAEGGLAPSQLIALPPEPADQMVAAASHFDIGLALEPAVSINNDLAISNKVFTYLLAGTAVVLSRTRGQASLLPELGRAAVGCEPGDPSSLASALQAWAADRQALEAARRHAWELGERRFNWDVEKHGFLDAVATAMDSSRAMTRIGVPAA